MKKRIKKRKATEDTFSSQLTDYLMYGLGIQVGVGIRDHIEIEINDRLSDIIYTELIYNLEDVFYAGL